ncbi:hypothetical protein P2G88_16880 [Aliiglaciecola sp. CAU 1673]|uniref:hypothetical protein n=1 Tax=Aliiglaciecola sp. CAU 1673 TaxID=3032595 RepID=UPI0023DA8D10|nr:hypothetical protein [Aliiglaciecola sp. CAU 1673]MDF2179930.1 hypothetical protein [Aliiglaciecola sp. CAU 1673]
MNQPPAILVSTWIKLLQQSEHSEAKEQAMKMLLASFGTMKAVEEYVKANKLDLR